ncbi:MAG: 6-bladed beta-propeller [Tannerellaceae bacterium]|nr:6-bladed beta-propeller [Tannerellaceae bacterium]
MKQTDHKCLTALFYVISLTAMIAPAGCSRTAHSPAATVRVIAVDVDRAGILKLSEYFEDVSYVALSDSCLVGEIERAKVYGDKLFLLSGKSLIVFDVNTGDALLELNRFGSGPGEYLSLTDILYDADDNTIELLDMRGRKICRYGLDGRFTGETAMPFPSFAFHKAGRSAYLFYNNNMVSDSTDGKLIRYDTQTSEITASYFPIDKHMASYFYVIDASNFGSASSPTFHFSSSDTVYGFTPDYVTYPKYVLDFGKHHTPTAFYNERYEDIRDFSIKAAGMSYIYAYGNFYENDYAAAFSFRNDDKTYWVTYDKRAQATCVADRWLDDYHSLAPVPVAYDSSPFVMDGGHLYFFLRPALLSAGAEESNPVLVKCRFMRRL